jgi:hypothetical protein
MCCGGGWNAVSDGIRMAMAMAMAMACDLALALAMEVMDGVTIRSN